MYRHVLCRVYEKYLGAIQLTSKFAQTCVKKQELGDYTYV